MVQQRSATCLPSLVTGLKPIAFVPVGLCKEPWVSGQKKQSSAVECMYRYCCGCCNPQHASEHMDRGWIYVMPPGVPTSKPAVVRKKERKNFASFTLYWWKSDICIMNILWNINFSFLVGYLSSGHCVMSWDSVGEVVVSSQPGWPRNHGLIPGRGNMSFSSLKSRLAMEPTMPSVHWVPGSFSRCKMAMAWNRPQSYICCWSWELVELYFHFACLHSVLGTALLNV